MLELWRKVRGTTPEEAVPLPVERPATEALIPRSRRRHYPKVVMMLVLGLEPATLRPLLTEITATDPPPPAADNGVEPPPVERSLEPLLVTDCTAFELFRGTRVLFEYLPGPAVRQRHAPELSWDVYVARRLERLRHKWAPVRIVAIGTVAREVLARQLVSPFSSPDLASLVGAVAGATALEHQS
jgi:hypothetical protein